MANVKTPRKKKEAVKPAEEKVENSKQAVEEKKEVDNSQKPVLSAQPSINIGMIGHVDHGKTTLVKALSGKWTDTHSEEIKRGITIRLGYADVSVYKCSKCEGVDAYGNLPECRHCQSKTELLRRVSLVDAPGHESLMATMLCGANIMDGALLLVAANETCPQPQTLEHIKALEIINIEKLIVIQNKIDLVSDEQAKKNYNEIKNLLKGTRFENSPILPVAAFHNVNIDAIMYFIETLFITPQRNLDVSPIMFVARSFDINKPGSDPEKIVGGILGGVLKQGKLKVGDEIEIIPGYETEQKNKKIWIPLTAKIENLVTGGKEIKEVLPGGSFALQTSLDPSVVKSDKLVGSVVGYSGKLPPVWYELKLKVNLLERVVGAKDKLVVEPIKLGEILMLNVYSSATVGTVRELGKNEVTCVLKRPVVADKIARVTISRMLGQRWRLIGWGSIG
ncbi:MAG: translation initiation factor IF-2 subunit gamma [Nanoarchaeota archaeon]